MEFVITIPIVISEEYVLKPLANAFGVVVIGYLVARLLNFEKKRKIASSAKVLYKASESKLNILQSSLDQAVAWKETKKVPSEGLIFPEIDFGGAIVRGIEDLPRWLPPSEFSNNVYYLANHLKRYESLKSSEIDYNDPEQVCELFRNALATACNVYIKLLYLADKKTYKKNNIELKCKDDIGYSLKYFKKDANISNRFWILLNKRSSS